MELHLRSIFVLDNRYHFEKFIAPFMFHQAAYENKLYNLIGWKGLESVPFKINSRSGKKYGLGVYHVMG